jgi:16S rRNA (adenine1518-N6/adenine1519-N6)-dimethyltransferase
MHPRARKALGQHFLHDPAVIAKIIAAVAPARSDRVLEIGGGRGALTGPLLAEVDSLDIVEIDATLARSLAMLAGPERLHVHHADALKFDYGGLRGAGEPLRVVGNLPYNISTPLLFRLLEQRETIRDMHLMLQREVVQRMVARPGSKDYGRLTVMLAAWTEIEVLFDIGPGAFNPAPRVWSTFIRVKPLDEARFRILDQGEFASLVARVFSMRRKTLTRSLRGRLSREQIEAADVDPAARPETLEPAAFARLAAIAQR